MSLKAPYIVLPIFQSYLSQYPEHVPSKLEDLEAHRMHDLPNVLQTRKSAANKAHMTKEELTRLVEWKLKHGTFRPKLLSLITSNSEADITEATTTGLAKYQADHDVNQAAAAISTLKGIGIATASLVLAAFDPNKVAFFGDEVFRWLMWDEPITKPGKGWDRVIGYTAKEYRRFAGLVAEAVERLGVPAVELEKVGYVLGRLRIDIDGKSQVGGASDDETVNTEKNDKKRKADKLVVEKESPPKKKATKSAAASAHKEPIRTSTRKLRCSD